MRVMPRVAIAACAIALPVVAAAQDTARVAVPDSGASVAAKADSARAAAQRDTVRALIAPAERPRGPLVVGDRTVFDRDALYLSGALTLADLASQVPGAAVFTSGLLAAPTATSWYGAPGRVRVFLDGVEIDALDPRLGGSPDLATIQLWPLEEVAFERGAGELRIHLRSWTVRYTPASTRTDILTGSENTNLYRGFYGKRFRRGGVLQFAGQQYSTLSARTRGDGDALAAFFRIGTVKGPLTVDAVMHRFGRTRTPTIREPLGVPENSAIRGFEGRDVTAYLRAAWNNPDSLGRWLQVVAATVQHIEDDSAAVNATVSNPDTVVTQGQFVVSAGANRGRLRFAATARYRTMNGEGRLSPALRVERLGVRTQSMLSFEGAGPDSTSRVELAFRRALPLSMWVAAATSQHTPTAAPDVSRGNTRVELGGRLQQYDWSVSAIHRGNGMAEGMMVFDSTYIRDIQLGATGVAVHLRGPLWGPFTFEWRGTQWDGEEFYRAPTETHAEIRVTTGLHEQLPRGTFYLTAALTHDWRGTVEMRGGGGAVERAMGAGVYGTLLDIRIGAAHVFWYNRNFTGKVYETVPGYLMPRLVQLYGVRWEFWN